MNNENIKRPKIIGSGCRTKKELRAKIQKDNKLREEKREKNEPRYIIDPIKCDCGITIKHGKDNPDLTVICPKCGMEWFVGV